MSLGRQIRSQPHRSWSQDFMKASICIYIVLTKSDCANWIQFYLISRLDFGCIQKVIIIEYSFELCNMMFEHQSAHNLDQNLSVFVCSLTLELRKDEKAGREVRLASVSWDFPEGLVGAGCMFSKWRTKRMRAAPPKNFLLLKFSTENVPKSIAWPRFSGIGVQVPLIHRKWSEMGLMKSSGNQTDSQYHFLTAWRPAVRSATTRGFK